MLFFDSELEMFNLTGNDVPIEGCGDTVPYESDSESEFNVEFPYVPFVVNDNDKSYEKTISYESEDDLDSGSMADDDTVTYESVFEFEFESEVKVCHKINNDQFQWYFNLNDSPIKSCRKMSSLNRLISRLQ